MSKNGIKHNLLNAKNHENEAKTIAEAGRLGSITLATNIAGRGIDIILGGTPPRIIQNSKFKIQNDSSRFDNQAEADNSKLKNDQIGLQVLMREHRTIDEWQDEHSKIKNLGGLCVIGTERHESRRIDNQLRGRSGRQGDPGESIFYVSMDDDLMRIFGGDRLKSLMNRLGLPEDMPIENKLISNSIESAQRKVEGHNFDIRKHLVEYDDVLNKHRTAIYSKRKSILQGLGKNKVGEQTQLHDEIRDLLTDEEKEIYLKKVDKYGIDLSKEIEKRIYLSVIDRHWIEHLTAIDELRTGIGLRGYGQKDPLVEYKSAAYHLFQSLIHSIENQTAEMIIKYELDINQIRSIQNSMPEESPKNIIETGSSESSTLETFSEIPEKSKNDSGVTVTVRKKGESSSFQSNSEFVPKVGRNNPCPCGSGKKYKKCHGK